MLNQNDLVRLEQAMSLERRRAFLKLLLAERRTILSQQAAHMAHHYESEESSREREAWQGGDVVEY